ncbi:hypothetical protein [Luteimonas sp. 100069]|uniref:hypothetical protein n=1 Tax=Luteimonas sp. 100069 TaxID=2006109 RepID=UPI000F50D385|nr:hypothetical protein [Luteimonas sp. 100069]
MFSSMRARGAIPAALVLLVAGCSQQPQNASAAPEAAPNLPAVTLEKLPAGVDATQEGNCSLDTINGQRVAAASLKVGDAATFVGWVGNAEGRVPQDGRLILEGEGGSYSAPVQVGIARPDVVAALGKPGLENAGFGVSTTLAVAPGMYRVYILMGESSPSVCHFDVSLTIAGG